MLWFGRRRERDGDRAERHQERASGDLRIDGAARAMQFVKDKQSPDESPELVGVGEGNAAADPDVLRGVLLEEVSNDPDEPAEHEPKQNVASASEFMP